MNSSKLRDWLEIVGMAGIIVSLVFVGLQIRQAERISLLETLNDGAERRLLVEFQLAEHADVWQRGCVGEDLTPAELAQFRKLVNAWLINNLASWQRMTVTEAAGRYEQYYINRAALSYHRFPGFRSATDAGNEYLSGVSDGYEVDQSAIDYTAAVFQRVEELRDSDPKPAVSPSLCGF